jgi:hypothetical protein
MKVTNKTAIVPLVGQWTHEDEHTLVVADDHGTEWIIRPAREGISISTGSGAPLSISPRATNAVVVRAAP